MPPVKKEVEVLSKDFSKVQLGSSAITSKKPGFDYMSKLPPEIQLKIFKNLQAEDKCMKSLTGTCTKFKKLCSNNLTHLVVDFKRFKKEDVIIKRAYKQVSVTNFELPIDMLELLKVFQTSVESVVKLNIGESSPESTVMQPFTPISAQALRFLFRCFPNVEDLNISRTTTRCRSAVEIVSLDLPKLKKLVLSDVTDDVLKALKNVTCLEELKVSGYFHSNSDNFKAFVTAQTNLNMLDTRPTFFDFAPNSMPNLKTFKGRVSHGIDDVFEMAPQLEHLVLDIANGDAEINTREYLRRCHSQNLKTLELISYTGHANEFLENFPCLDIAKCSPILNPAAAMVVEA